MISDPPFVVAGADAVLTSILPPGVIVAELHGSFDHLPKAVECSLMGERTIKNRIHEFSAGRFCAHEALRVLGMANEPIVIGKNREPIWPSGIVGSITHCPRYCAAALAPQQLLRSVGIDAEPNLEVPPEVVSYVASDRERLRLRLLETASWRIDRLLFSIKESVFKAWYPLEQTFLDFPDAEVWIDADTQTFRALVHKKANHCPQELSGKFKLSGSLILSTCCIYR